MENKIEQLVKQLGDICKSKRYSLVTAESCSGGGLAYFISKEPHTSCILERGYVTYSSAAKQEILGVSPHTIHIYGAVSKEAVIEMVEGALKNSKAQISVAITGVAEIKDHSEGVAWIGCAGTDKKTFTICNHYHGDRETFCKAVILDALNALLKFVAAEEKSAATNA